MNCPFAFSEPSLIFVPGNLDQIPIRVPEVNRADGARGAGALHGSEFDRNTVFRKPLPRGVRTGNYQSSSAFLRLSASFARRFSSSSWLRYASSMSPVTYRPSKHEQSKSEISGFISESAPFRPSIV